MFYIILFHFLEISELEFVIIFGFFLFALLVLFAILFLITSYKRKQNHKEQLNKLTYQKHQAILQTQIEIQEQTLKNISQEIHDNIGQVLTLAKLNLNTLPATANAASQIKIDDTRQLITKALRDLRDLSRSMHGDKIAELGLQQAIADELKILQNSGQFTTRLQVAGDTYKLEPQKEMVIFRMVQESLNNAIKHSRAKNIEVSLQYTPAVFNLCIADDGMGFNPVTLQSAETGIGLKNMLNRATLIGANFLIDSNANHGTTITIALQNTDNPNLIF